MFLKLMLRIVEVLSNVLVLISQVAALNWSDAIDPNLGYPRQKRRKIDILSRKVLDVENSWGPKQRFGINFRSDTIYPNLLENQPTFWY